MIVGLILFDRAVVVHEDEGALILGVAVARGSLVSGAQVALMDNRMSNRNMTMEGGRLRKGRTRAEWMQHLLLAGLCRRLVSLSAQSHGGRFSLPWTFGPVG